MFEDYLTKSSKCTQDHIEEIERVTKMYGLNHPKVAESFNALGLAYQYISKEYRSALYCHSQALIILTRDQNKASTGLQTGIILNDIANTYDSLGDTRNVIVAFHGALDAFRSIGLSDDHPRVLSTINRMIRLRIPLPTENKQIKSNVMNSLPAKKYCKELLFRSGKVPCLRRASSAPSQDRFMKLNGLSKRCCKSGTNLATVMFVCVYHDKKKGPEMYLKILSQFKF